MLKNLFPFLYGEFLQEVEKEGIYGSRAQVLHSCQNLKVTNIPRLISYATLEISENHIINTVKNSRRNKVTQEYEVRHIEDWWIVVKDNYCLHFFESGIDAEKCAASLNGKDTESGKSSESPKVGTSY